jgi:hypothetical protein
MKIIEIVESRQKEYHNLDILTSRIQVFSKLVIDDINYVLNNPEFILEQEFPEFIDAIDRDILILRKTIEISKIGMNDLNSQHHMAKKIMAATLKKVSDARSKIQSNLSEADQPPQGSLYSPLSAANRRSKHVDPRIKAKQEAAKHKMDRWMGHRD